MLNANDGAGDVVVKSMQNVSNSRGNSGGMSMSVGLGLGQSKDSKGKPIKDGNGGYKRDDFGHSSTSGSFNKGSSSSNSDGTRRAKHFLLISCNP